MSPRLLQLMGAFVVMASSVATAQTLDVSSTMALGSGVSFGQGNGTVIKKTSPLFLDIDVGLVFDGDTTLEYSPGLMIELQGRVSVGVNPAVKYHYRWERLGIYGGLGLPIFFAPFTLIGVEPALGVTYRLVPRLFAVAELHVDIFFAGSDLPDDGIVAKTDFSLGLRFDF